MKSILRLFLTLICLYSCDVIFEKDISNSPIKLISPSQQVVLKDSIINFYWNSIDDATLYKIQIANPNFYNAKGILVDSILDVTNFQYFLKSGTYQWRIAALNSEYQTNFVTRDFTVQLEDTDISNKKILLIAPSNQVKLEKGLINFHWESIKDATNYSFQIAYPNFENAVQLLKDTIIINNNIKMELGTGNFQWRVRANNKSYQTVFSTNDLKIIDTDIKDITTEKLNLIAPSNNVSINQGDIQFNWNKINGATTYQFQIATPNFDTPIQIITDTITSNLSYQITALPVNSYQWRVRAINTISKTEFFLHSLQVINPNASKNITSKKINLLAPYSGASIRQGTINFNWDVLDGATKYHFQIATPNFDNPTQILEDIDIINPSFSINLSSGNYQWRVKGKNTTYETTYTTSTLTITP